MEGSLESGEFTDRGGGELSRYYAQAQFRQRNRDRFTRIQDATEADNNEVRVPIPFVLIVNLHF